MHNKILNIFSEVKKIQPWMLMNLVRSLQNKVSCGNDRPLHFFICICDHFEPLGAERNKEKGLERVKKWCKHYPWIADKHNDSDGNKPKYTFFYPIDEYEELYIRLLSKLCKAGYGEIELHLHHDNDTGYNLRKTLLDYKKLLVDKFKLLSIDKFNKEITYGFIHGDWALDNSRPDGRLCGVNNELDILKSTGCYADFTMPSAPDITQTRKINSVYYAVDNPLRPKSHDSGRDVKNIGYSQSDGLLMVQGPLMLNWSNRKYGLMPRIENSYISNSLEIERERVNLWANANIHVKGKPEYIFIKLHAHGGLDENLNYLLNKGLDNLFTSCNQYFDKQKKIFFHYVTARELVNIIRALESDECNEDLELMKNYRYLLNA